MIEISELQQYYPLQLQNKPQYYGYILKEYFHYKMLDIIFNSLLADRLSLIGGSGIRIVHQIERFSEDLDFDLFDLSRDEFIELTNLLIKSLQNEGIQVIADDKDKDLKLNAFRRNLIFPEILYSLGISGHKQQRFLIKVECEPHGIRYVPDKPIIQKFNILTQINATPVDILLSMKIGAALERQKGRDYYDCIYLMGKTQPNWDYLSEKFRIRSEKELKGRFVKSCENVDFKKKARDFEKLVFNPGESEKVKLFPQYIRQKF